ncbi:FecR domain-containing protein [Fibrella sp. ES10-3-2-2]|nr:iron dicitrate transport regulator FecR [Fibrella sp. ES10-3-2-2]
MDYVPDTFSTVEDFLESAAFRTWVRERRREDQVYWQQWLAQYPEKRELYEQAVSTLLAIQGTEQTLSDQQVRDKVALMLSEIPQPFSIQNTVSDWTWVRWAVAATLLVSLFFLKQLQQPIIDVFRQLGGKREQLADKANWKTVKNSTGQPLVILLPDNSSVLLSTGSQLRFHTTTKYPLREVFLKGEGFFEVAKDPTKPFIVYTADLTAKVVGTSFKIRAFEADSSTQVRVKTGKVTVASAQVPAKTILLTVNEELRLGSKKTELVKATRFSTKDDPSILIAQQFTFSYTPVSAILDKLEDCYFMPIQYDRDVLSQCTFTGELNDMPFLEKIRLICLTIESSFEIVDNQIIIHSKGCK